MRKESKIERGACHTALHSYGVPNIKLLHTGGETGWPDRMFFIPGGRPLLIEFKELGYTPEPRQTYIHDMLRGLGYDVYWVDTEEAALTLIRQAMDAAQYPEERR